MRSRTNASVSAGAAAAGSAPAASRRTLVIPQPLDAAPDLGQRQVLALESPDEPQAREMALAVACRGPAASGEGSSPCAT